MQRCNPGVTPGSRKMLPFALKICLLGLHFAIFSLGFGKGHFVMSDRTVPFTAAKIEGLPIPETGRDTWIDSKTPGLQLRVTPTGVKTFSWFRRTKGGGPERITLGRWPEMSIDAARTHASRLNSETAEGGSPATQRRERLQEMTLAELFNVYLDRWAKPRKKTWKDDESMFRIHLSKLHGSRLSAITKKDIASIHSQIGVKQPTTANRVLAVVSKMFNVASEFGMWHGENPAKGIRRFEEKSRDRFLALDEIQAVFKSLEEEDIKVRSFFLLALFTGARRADVLAMRWDQISLDQHTWRIPVTKNGRPVIVPLVPVALNLLATLRNEHPNSDWVFPAPKSRTGHYVEPRKAWERVVARAGIEGVRIHDLRRTMGSWQAITGASLPIIGKSLGHQSQQATAIYARLDLDPVRAAMAKATDAMMGANGLGKGEDIVKKT